MVQQFDSVLNSNNVMMGIGMRYHCASKLLTPEPPRFQKLLDYPHPMQPVLVLQAMMSGVGKPRVSSFTTTGLTANPPPKAITK